MIFHLGNKSIYLKTVGLFIVLFIAFVTKLIAQDFPAKSDKLVNDYADFLNEQEEATLENKLVAYYDSTSTQIAIVTIKTLNGYDANDYAQKLAESWGIGKKDKDNGLVILVTKEEHDICIQTGYGVESFVTDALAKRIELQVIVPEFKNGNFYNGLDLGVNAVVKALAGQYKDDEPVQKKGSNRIFVFIIIIIIIIVISRKGRGGRGGGFMSSDPFYGGFGGFSSGGSSWGGGFGGGSSGGFGGFGGGSFGGGGASSKW